jgi:hypothetical protein
MWLVVATVTALGSTSVAGAGAAPATDEVSAGARTAPRDTPQVGFALAAETVVSPGSVCPGGATAPCLLGSGGGVAVRFGYRLGNLWYFGGAYEFTRHDSSNLMRLAILQQLRAEGRYYIERGNRATGFLAAGVGAHIYGNDWGASTAGGLVTTGIGVELELSPKAVVAAAAMYRLLIPKSFRDSTGEQRGDGPFGFGFAHMIGLEFALEVRDPVPHW